MKMFETTFRCRLCLNTRTELETLITPNEEHNEIYQITVKYFDPMLLTTVMVICSECWHHIRDFHEFQQSILKAHENLNVIEEPLINLENVRIDEDGDDKEEMKIPIFESVETNEFNELSSDDEVPLADYFASEIREFEELETIKPDGNDAGQCPYCPRKLSTYKSLFRHIKILHPEQFAEYKRNREIKQMNAKRIRQQKQQKTVKVKTGNGLIQCPHCDKTFKVKQNLTCHMKISHPKEYAVYKDQTKPKFDIIYSLLQSLGNGNVQLNNKKNNDIFEGASLLHVLENCGSESKNEENEQKGSDTLEEATVQQKTHEFDAFIAKWKQELECNICKHLFANYHLLSVHFKEEHPGRSAHIVCCENKFWCRPDIVEHIIFHLNPSTFKCKICEKKSFSTYRRLNNHIQNLHSNEVKENLFECNVCQKPFRRKDKLKVHIGIHSADRDHICKMCDKGYPSELILKRHMYNAHNRRRLCDHCGKSCLNSDSLRLHLLEHKTPQYLNKTPQYLNKTPQYLNKTPQYHCNKCSSNFKTRGFLDRHKRVVHNDGPTVYYKCNVCNKTCPTKSALYQHKKKFHENKIKLELEPKFQCQICYKRFKYGQNLRLHSTTHTGLALFQCPHCPTKFKSKGNIRRHVKKFHYSEELEMFRS